MYCEPSILKEITKTIPSFSLWMLLFISTGQLIMCRGKVYESFACQRLWNSRSTPTSTLLWHPHGLAHVTGNWGQRAAQHKKVFGVAWQFDVSICWVGSEATNCDAISACICIFIHSFWCLGMLLLCLEVYTYTDCGWTSGKLHEMPYILLCDVLSFWLPTNN